MPGYDPTTIEKKWQKVWAEKKVFAATADAAKPKFYVLDMFPYPSGQGLHVGHPEGYTATDIVARYKRARGFAVMHPMGWDAFGLPAEQYAIKTNTHPRVTTENNVKRFRGQLQAIGFSYDWDREVDTTDPNYYRWTQWIFLQLFDTWFDEQQQKGRPIGELVAEFRSGKRRWDDAATRGRGDAAKGTWDQLSATEQRRILAGYRLAYEAEVPVNWCPGLGTVLANEEVIDGKSEVGGFPVERRPMRQWMLRITAYAQRLLEGLEKLEWSDSLKEMQRNWIGRSDGAEVRFQLADVPGVDVGCTDERIVHTGLGAITVFTTRPDTLFGATYMVIAPEHELAKRIGWFRPEWAADVPDSWKGGCESAFAAVKGYQEYAASRSERERQEDTRKTGVFTGYYAINPVNQARIPIFVSDYVLMGYGTGAIMAVPGHDERDHEFATKFGLPIVQVVAPRAPDGNPGRVDVQKAAFAEDGVAVNSPWIDGLPTAEAKAKTTQMLEEKGLGTRQVNYKIRDWLFSRQRYWGEPFPLVHLADGTIVRLADSELPVRLPELADFKPTGTIDPPLSKATGWVDVHVVVEGDVARVVPAGTPGAVPARRELNTMPQWAGSCWYYLRYCDPRNSKAFIDPAAEKYWLHNGVDLYVGGVEHAVLHLLYSRFWHKVLFDRGLVSAEEPFRRLVNQGLILGEMEFIAFHTDCLGPDGRPIVEYVSLENVSADWTTEPDRDGKLQTRSVDMTNGHAVFAAQIPETEVEKKGDSFVLKAHPHIKVDARSYKMSKSRGNVVNPDDVIRDYGADSLRMFEMFMGPLEQVKPWSTTGVEGVYRFLQRVWRNLFDVENGEAVKPQAGLKDEALDRAMHRLVKKVTEDIERMSFNTAIAAMMQFNNTLGQASAAPMDVALTLVRLMEPFAPHFAEEVYHRLVPNAAVVSVSQLPWPTYDPAKLVDATIEVPVQVNGKLKSRVTVANDATDETVFAAALADAEVQKALAGKPVKKKIYVKGRMANIVV